jgi:hypothetical protein
MRESTRCRALAMSVFVEACSGRADDMLELKADERKRWTWVVVKEEEEEEEEESNRD